MKFNILKLEVKDLSGAIIPINNAELGQLIGNYIYTTRSDLGWLEKAQAIYKGKTLELSEEDALQLSGIISAPEAGFTMAVKTALLEVLKNNTLEE